MPTDIKPAGGASVKEQDVLNYLRTHPTFLKKHPELLAVLSPPARDMGGDAVVDFQHFQLKKLQKNSTDLQGKYSELVTFCRDNLSIQSQVHEAVLRLIRTRNLEQLLEVMALDFVSLFSVDVVRLVVESEIAGLAAGGLALTQADEPYGSGLAFVPPGTIDEMLGNEKQVLLIEDTEKFAPGGMEMIFPDCADLVKSVALFTLSMEQVERGVMLAFGVRHPGRFHTGQGTELLSFLAQVLAQRLDIFLNDLPA